MRSDSTKRKRETCGSGNVTDYALHAGPGVNETSDEKRNLPSSIISTANSLCSNASPPPLWVFPQGLVIGGKGKEGDTSKKMMSF